MTQDTTPTQGLQKSGLHDETWGYLIGEECPTVNAAPGREEAVAAAQEYVNATYPKDHQQRVQIGIWRRPKARDYIRVDLDSILEDAETNAQDDEWWDGGEPLFEPRGSDVNAEGELANALRKWADDHLRTTERYTLRDAEWMTLTSRGSEAEGETT